MLCMQAFFRLYILRRRAHGAADCEATVKERCWMYLLKERCWMLGERLPHPLLAPQ